MIRLLVTVGVTAVGVAVLSLANADWQGNRRDAGYRTGAADQVFRTVSGDGAANVGGPVRTLAEQRPTTFHVSQPSGSQGSARVFSINEPLFVAGASADRPDNDSSGADVVEEVRETPPVDDVSIVEIPAPASAAEDNPLASGKARESALDESVIVEFWRRQAVATQPEPERAAPEPGRESGDDMSAVDGDAGPEDGTEAANQSGSEGALAPEHTTPKNSVALFQPFVTRVTRENSLPLPRRASRRHGRTLAATQRARSGDQSVVALTSDQVDEDDASIAAFAENARSVDHSKPWNPVIKRTFAVAKSEPPVVTAEIREQARQALLAAEARRRAVNGQRYGGSRYGLGASERSRYIRQAPQARRAPTTRRYKRNRRRRRVIDNGAFADKGS